MSEEGVRDIHRWNVQAGWNEPKEYVSQMAWVTDSGALMIGSHVDGKWVPDVVLNVGEWQSVVRIEEG